MQRQTSTRLVKHLLNISDDDQFNNNNQDKKCPADDRHNRCSDDFAVDNLEENVVQTTFTISCDNEIVGICSLR